MDSGARVAVYWDFENVHASILDEIQGDGAYQRQHFKPQDRVVDLDPVIDYAAGFGSVVVNRAYANWQWLSKYRGVLQSQAVDLVQMFPLSGLKNGADIRLALDVMEDLHQHDHITHVVVVAGDSDYVALAQKCRKLGRQFIGVGMPKTNALFKAACDEFKYYRSIVSALGSGEDPLTEENPVYELDDAADLLLRALRGLAVGAESPWVLKAAVRPMLVRLDSTFDEANYGFTSLNALLAALDSSIVERAGEHDRELAPRAALGAEKHTDPAAPASIDTEIDPVDRALRRVQVRLPTDRSLLWRSGPLLIEVFRSRPDGTAASLQDVVGELQARLNRGDGTATEQDVKRLKNIFFKLGVFELLGQEVGVRLRIVEERALFDRTVHGLLERIRAQAPDLLDDEETLLRGLCGDNSPPELVDEIVRIKR